MSELEKELKELVFNVKTSSGMYGGYPTDEQVEVLLKLFRTHAVKYVEIDEVELIRFLHNDIPMRKLQCKNSTEICDLINIIVKLNPIKLK